MVKKEGNHIKVNARNLVSEARACQLCRFTLAHNPRPIFQINPRAKILIAGQAPGARAHEQGVPFDDASGDRLRDWMALDRTTFYDAAQIAILPMAFCYPGRGPAGDQPPPPVCAATWRARFLQILPDIQLTLVIGQYAQQWHLPDRLSSVTRTVAAWRGYDPCIPLPHPSPRNNFWLKKNPWFEMDLLPELKKRVAQALS